MLVAESYQPLREAPRAHVRHLYRQQMDPAKLSAGILAYPAVAERLIGNDLDAAATPVRQTGA